jgi:hypothetical protein
MAQVTGKAIIRVDGEEIPTENGAKLNPGGVNRNPEAHGGNVYYREEDVAPELTAQVMHTADIDIKALGAIDNATVIFEADTGQRYIMRGAFTTKPVELDAGNGRADLVMSARACDKE